MLRRWAIASSRTGTVCSDWRTLVFPLSSFRKSFQPSGWAMITVLSLFVSPSSKKTESIRGVNVCVGSFRLFSISVNSHFFCSGVRFSPPVGMSLVRYGSNSGNIRDLPSTRHSLPAVTVTGDPMTLISSATSSTVHS